MWAGQPAPLLDQLTIVVPAVPGSGWDELARAIQRISTGGNLVRQVRVQNIPGQSGVTGLYQFVGSYKRNPNQKYLKF